MSCIFVDLDDEVPQNVTTKLEMLQKMPQVQYSVLNPERTERYYLLLENKRYTPHFPQCFQVIPLFLSVRVVIHGNLPDFRKKQLNY